MTCRAVHLRRTSCPVSSLARPGRGKIVGSPTRPQGFLCDMRYPQVYIGHSEPVRAVAFTPDQQHLLSVGDAIFLWDILASTERSPPGRQVPSLAQ